MGAQPTPCKESVPRIGAAVALNSSHREIGGDEGRMRAVGMALQWARDRKRAP